MNIMIFGPQGSGKGAQAGKISEKYGLEHVETGQIFREIAQEDNQLGRNISELINEKKDMVPDSITVDVLKHYLRKISPDKGVILDSAPRTMGQIEPVEKMLKEFGRSLDKAIYINLPYDKSIERISKRYVCPVCHTNFVLGKDLEKSGSACPSCGGIIVQRDDDTPEGIAKRLKVFYEVTIPVVEYYREKGRLIEIDGDQTMEKVFEDINNALK